MHKQISSNKSYKFDNLVSDDNTIRIWDLEKQEEEDGYCRVLRGHMDEVRSVIELRNGKLVSGSSDYTIRIWGATIDNEETET